MRQSMAKTAQLGVPDNIRQYMANAYSGQTKQPASNPSALSAKQIDALLADAVEKKWTSIKIKGTDDFKEAVWSRAQKLGIAVDGYTPSKEAVARHLSAEKRHKKGAGLLSRFFNKLDPKYNKDPGKLNVHQGYDGPSSKSKNFNRRVDREAEYLKSQKPSMALRALLRVNDIVNHPLVQVPLLVGAFCTGPGGCMAYGALMAAKDAAIGVAFTHQKRKEQLAKVKSFTEAGLYREAARVSGTSRFNYLKPVFRMGAAVALSYAGGFVLGASFGAGAQAHTLGNGLGMLATKIAVAGACLTAATAIKGDDFRSKRHVMATVASIGLGAIGASYVGGAHQDFMWGGQHSAFFGDAAKGDTMARLASWRAHLR